MSGFFGQPLFGKNAKVRIFWSPDFKQTTVSVFDKVGRVFPMVVVTIIPHSEQMTIEKTRPTLQWKSLKNAQLRRINSDFKPKIVLGRLFIPSLIQLDKVRMEHIFVLFAKKIEKLLIFDLTRENMSV